MADHFVIDGSNLATEGRTEPSLAQLRDAVAAFRAEHPDAMVTVVVDASFEHRIDPAERAAFAKAEVANEVVSPPAGAVGRGDGFLLQIANRTDATVLSNDSFQEFHAEYDWLFEPGRLIGGKPVPGVGWIFSLRRPVRGIVSRKTTQRAKKEARAEAQVREAIAEATADALTSQPGGRKRRRGGRGARRTEAAEPEAVNEPAPFLQFVIDHRLGTEVEGLVDAFSSHGAFVVVDGVRCYIPLGAMGDPRPTRARDVLQRGETRAFVVQAVDAPRRGVELALPGFAKVAGAPSEETVAAEVTRRRVRKPAETAGDDGTATPAKRATKRATKARPTAGDDGSPTKDGATAKAAAKDGAKAKRAKAPAKDGAKDGAKAKPAKAPARTPAAPTPARKASPAKAPAGKKAATKAAGLARAAAKPATRPGAKKKAAAAKAPPAPAAKKRAPAAKAPAAPTPAKAARGAAVKKAPAKAPAKSTPAKKTTTGQPAAKAPVTRAGRAATAKARGPERKAGE